MKLLDQILAPVTVVTARKALILTLFPVNAAQAALLRFRYFYDASLEVSVAGELLSFNDSINHSAQNLCKLSATKSTSLQLSR